MIEEAVRRAMGLEVEFPVPAPPGEPSDVAIASWILAGFVTLADWLGSNADVFEMEERDIDLAQYWRQTRARAVTAVGQASLAPVQVSADSRTSALFPGLEPRPMQEAAEVTTLGDGPSLFIIEDQTGAGKTQAALVLAHRLMRRGDAGGLFFGLPTMATADAMYSRMRADHAQLFAKEETATLSLLHGQSRLRRVDSDDAAPTLSAWMQDSRKKAFLAHIGVGTIDQALLGTLPVRHQSLRLFALASRVLIVDEVHAYDTYMMRLLCKLLAHQRCVGGSAIILSATLPKRSRRQLVVAWGLDKSDLSDDYPLLTLAAEQVYERKVDPTPGLARSIRIELHEIPESLVNALREATSRGRCAGWIRNTVDDALDAHALLAADGADVYHSRFMAGDRREREEALVGWAGKKGTPQERAGKVVVSTQVLEQSLDIDFDVLATDLAPMDLILQRAGRLHRHDRPGRDHPPTLHVFCPPWADEDAVREDWYERAFPRAQYVYRDHAQLWRTLRSLRTRGGVIEIPHECRTLIEEAHDASTVPPGLSRRERDAEGERGARWSFAEVGALDLAGGYRAGDHKWEDDSVASTRFEDPGSASRDAWLAREDESGNVVPLAGTGRWDESRLRIPLRAMDPTPDMDKRAPGVMHDHGSSSAIILMRPDGAGWCSIGTRKAMLYTRGRGLEILAGEGD